MLRSRVSLVSSPPRAVKRKNQMVMRYPRVGMSNNTRCGRRKAAGNMRANSTMTAMMLNGMLGSAKALPGIQRDHCQGPPNAPGMIAWNRAVGRPKVTVLVVPPRPKSRRGRYTTSQPAVTTTSRMIDSLCERILPMMSNSTTMTGMMVRDFSVKTSPTSSTMAANHGCLRSTSHNTPAQAHCHA